MERRQLVRFLQHVPLFRGLQADEIDVVAGAARVRDVERGRFFFRPGAPAEVAYVLCRGRVKLTQSTGDGASVVVRFVGPGDLFGIETLLDRRLYRLAASAVRPSRALAWRAATMTGLMERYPRIALNTLRELSGRMQDRSADGIGDARGAPPCASSRRRRPMAAPEPRSAGASRSRRRHARCADRCP